MSSPDELHGVVPEAVGNCPHGSRIMFDRAEAFSRRLGPQGDGGERRGTAGDNDHDGHPGRGLSAIDDGRAG